MALVPSDGVGSLCSNRRIGNHGRNEGCQGRLVLEPHTQFAPGRYRPDAEGDIVLLVCPQCGQSHGRVA